MIKYVKRQSAFYFLIGMCAAVNTFLVNAQDFFIPENEDLFIEIPTDWKEIDKGKKTDVLRLLISTRQYNRDTIKTYSAKYTIDTILEASGIEEAMVISQENKQQQHKDLYRHINFTVDVVSDVVIRKTLRNVVYNKDVFKDNGETVNLENIPLDTASITTPYEYIHYQEGMTLTNLPELPNYTFNDDKFAWIDPPEMLGKTNYLTLLDPFEYYDQKPWGFLEGILKAMDGENGEDERKFIDGIVSLYETTDKYGVKWFRFCERLTSPNGDGIVYLNNLWNESSGLMPIFSSLLSDSKGSLNYVLQVKWNCVDNVYVPTETRYAMYRHDGVLIHRRHMIITDTKVNKPINEETFSYKSLGLPEGCVIVDRTKKKFYTYEKGRKNFLADFFAKHVQQTYSINDRFSKKRVFIVVLGLTMLGSGIYLRYRRKR